ncbi:unnamed protein product (macronuclear) [Paramecium tetraurelia]|uniref:TLDc domain-containing protein n=1 Tax=Paramecium tetraurelia TaxID=5888 RepID=A0E5Y2_PARTE|nr:uncharacterized protein GSPATT00003562001 [Paramecium tetraurelia]CAK90699.1 unnamed protein product [Paramecium tetraurelia]|eukprot:XP_001458096.1 hypothetical protein (macronuclear) [Paramecium tetraurelia strain d4-2]
MQVPRQIGIYCQDDQHFHRGQKIKYLMVKKDKGTIQKRLFCDECFLGKYNSLQQHCCNLEELINGRNYEAFKYTKFDSNNKQQYFNYARNHHPYLDIEFIYNMVSSLQEEIQSKIRDMMDIHKQKQVEYLNELIKWTENPKISNYFNCDELKEVLLNEKFERSPEMFKDLNEKAEIYIDEEAIFKIDDIVTKQKRFFDLDRFNASFKDIMQSIQKIEETTFTDYKFSTSTLATPYLETIVEKIAPKNEENFYKNMKRIYRMTQQGSNYQTLQQIELLEQVDTITVIQTKNNCIFGVYNCIENAQNSILFQMNKKKFFQFRKINKTAFELNKKSNLSDWILKFGDGDILINSSFTKCTSKLGAGFDISDTDIFNPEEYLSNCREFDVYDIEIFQTSEPTKIRNTLPLKQPPPLIKMPVNQTGSLQGSTFGSINDSVQILPTGNPGSQQQQNFQPPQRIPGMNFQDFNTLQNSSK